MDSKLKGTAGGSLETGAPAEPLASLSISDGDDMGAQQPPTQSLPQQTPRPDQLQQALKLVEDVASCKLRLRPEAPIIEFTLSRESWLELKGKPNFDECTERKAFRVSYDSSRSLVTIMPPPSSKHEAVLKILSRVAHAAQFSFPPIVQDKMAIGWGEYVDDFEGQYGLSEKQPDLSIQWYKSNDDGNFHTVVEVGVSQTLKSLRSLVPLYLKGKQEIQRVVLVKMTETAEADMLWEVWERDADGDPERIFDETMRYGAPPSKPIPFFGIPGYIAQDIPEVFITVDEVKSFWLKEWDRGVQRDARRKGKGVTA